MLFSFLSLFLNYKTHLLLFSSLHAPHTHTPDKRTTKRYNNSEEERGGERIWRLNMNGSWSEVKMKIKIPNEFVCVWVCVHCPILHYFRNCECSLLHQISIQTYDAWMSSIVDDKIHIVRLHCQPFIVFIEDCSNRSCLMKFRLTIWWNTALSIGRENPVPSTHWLLPGRCCDKRYSGSTKPTKDDDEEKNKSDLWATDYSVAWPCMGWLSKCMRTISFLINMF